MPRSVICLFEGENISINKALELRNFNRKNQLQRPDFQCIECGELVRAHKGNSKMGAHFEHLKRQKNCRLSVAF